MIFVLKYDDIFKFDLGNVITVLLIQESRILVDNIRK